MPMYEFACEPCDARLTVKRRISEAADPTRCPHCYKLMRRVFSAPNIAPDGRYSYKASA